MMAVCSLSQNRPSCRTLKLAVLSHFKIGGFVSFSKSAVLSHFRNRRFCLIFKIGGFVSFKIGCFVLPPKITICFSTPIQKNNILHCIKALLCTVTALDESDLQVQKGDVVSLLNDEDPDWFWVSYSNGSGDVCQGFVPSNFTYKYEGSCKPLYCRFS